MLNRFRDRFGTAGLVVSIMALVLALAGGAFAASGGLNAKQKKQVKAIAKSFQGTGPAGTNGTNGTNGAKGDPGTAGVGTQGDPGTSVVSSVEPNGVNCTKGGSNFVAGASTTYACNGADGTFGSGTLPQGQSLTGVWGARGINMAGLSAAVTIPIPLASAPTANYVQCGNFGCTPTVDCPSTAPGTPTATPGKLCVYGRPLQNLTGPPSIAPYPNGFFLEVPTTDPAAESMVTGTWAVKAS